MKQYIVDAFTNQPFSGNPAAVCVMNQWPSDERMLLLARENNLSETAFVVREDKGYHLRWFTPGTEVELCGHATLATAFVILTLIEPEADEVHFNTLSGELIIKRRDNMFEMDLPTYPLREVPVTEAMTEAFGTRPSRAILGLDLICVFDDEQVVRSMQPDPNKLMQLDGRIQHVTARGHETDCVSRSFCPKLAIAEDPVCGSGHCQIADYWSDTLNKPEIYAYQASARGGYLRCIPHDGNRMYLLGEAVLVATTELYVEMY